MEHNRQSDGYQWVKFLEHWGMLLTALIAVITSQLLMFFTNLSGATWVCFFVAICLLLFAGAALIVYAKIPVYRSGRYFTFGVKSVPEHLTGYYRWGSRVFLFGVVLSLCLLLSRQ